MITKSEWINWKQNEVTKIFLEYLVANRAAKLEEIADGRCSTDREIYTVIGQVQGLFDAIDFAKSGMKDAVMENEDE